MACPNAFVSLLVFIHGNLNMQSWPNPQTELSVFCWLPNFLVAHHGSRGFFLIKIIQKFKVRKFHIHAPPTLKKKLFKITLNIQMVPIFLQETNSMGYKNPKRVRKAHHEHIWQTKGLFGFIANWLGRYYPRCATGPTEIEPQLVTIWSWALESSPSSWPNMSSII
jgi:hypothetical protein